MNLRAILAAGVVTVMSAAALVAQEQPEIPAPAENPALVASDRVQSTPEMWFYQQQQQRYDDPKMAVRRNAEYQAKQRQWRIAMMRAQGLSKMRPRVSHTPMFDNYIPTQDPYRWNYGRGVMRIAAPQSSLVR